jgi:hypothetical protein
MSRIKVRFHLSKGVHFMHWQVRIGDAVSYYDPSQVRLTMTNARLVNHASTAKKIFEGQNKSVCSWVACESLEVMHKDDAPLTLTYEKCRVFYNPKRQPNWTDINGNILDGTTHKTIVSIENRLYKQA